MAARKSSVAAAGLVQAALPVREISRKVTPRRPRATTKWTIWGWNDARSITIFLAGEDCIKMPARTCHRHDTARYLGCHGRSSRRTRIPLQSHWSRSPPGTAGRGQQLGQGVAPRCDRPACPGAAGEGQRHRHADDRPQGVFPPVARRTGRPARREQHERPGNDAVHGGMHAWSRRTGAERGDAAALAVAAHGHRPYARRGHDEPDQPEGRRRGATGTGGIRRRHLLHAVCAPGFSARADGGPACRQHPGSGHRHGAGASRAGDLGR